MTPDPRTGERDTFSWDQAVSDLRTATQVLDPSLPNDAPLRVILDRLRTLYAPENTDEAN